MEQETELRREDDEIDDSASVTPLEFIVFLCRATRRHCLLGAFVGIFVGLVGVAIALAIPAKYEAQTRILASQSAAIAAALSNPNRPINNNNVNPFRAAPIF